MKSEEVENISVIEYNCSNNTQKYTYMTSDNEPNVSLILKL